MEKITSLNMCLGMKLGTLYTEMREYVKKGFSE